MRTLIAAAAATLIAAAVPAAAHDVKVGDLEITSPWTRATPPGAANGGGFVTITNTGTVDDRLVGAASPIAKKVELHTMEMADGVMKMRPIEGGIAVPAGETVRLAPGGDHIMFMGLKTPIKAGTLVPVTLTFETAGPTELEMTATPPGAPGPDGDGHGHGMKMPKH